MSSPYGKFTQKLFSQILHGNDTRRARGLVTVQTRHQEDLELVPLHAVNGVRDGSVGFDRLQGLEKGL